jgi:glycosyltransferase involved in cell wall biosynthesis
LKIGVFNDGNIPTLYAHSFSVMKMAQGFAELGHQAQVVTANSLRSLGGRLRHGDLNAHYGMRRPMPVSWLMPTLRHFLDSNTQNDPLYAQRAASLARRAGLDLVYARSFRTPVLTVQAGIPTVVETHTTLYDFPFLANIYQVAQLPAFRGLITIHADIAQEHARRGVPADKILVLEDGVDLERFQVPDDPRHWKSQLGLDPAKHYAIYSGHLYPEKGIQVILEAAQALRARQDLVFLLVGGFPADQQHWERECRRLGLDNVAFTGFVPNSRVPGYLKAASCLLLPYRVDLSFKVMDVHTTSPLKLFEYMAAARAIVATDVPTVGKVLTHQHSALLVPPGDGQGFARAVLRAVDERGLASQLAGQACRRVQDLSWTERCRRVLELAHPA